MIRFAVIMRTACFPEISYRKILVKFSTYPDPLEWVLLLEDITTTESLNQSQAACRSIDRRIYMIGHCITLRQRTYLQWEDISATVQQCSNFPWQPTAVQNQANCVVELCKVETWLNFSVCIDVSNKWLLLRISRVEQKWCKYKTKEE